MNVCKCEETYAKMRYLRDDVAMKGHPRLSKSVLRIIWLQEGKARWALNCALGRLASNTTALLPSPGERELYLNFLCVLQKCVIIITIDRRSHEIVCYLNFFLGLFVCRSGEGSGGVGGGVIYDCKLLNLMGLKIRINLLKF